MDPELIDLLRADLEAADYRPATVTALIGEEADGARQRGLFAPARRALAERGDDALGILIRLFLLGDAVDAPRVDAALPGLGGAGAVRLGLLRADASAGGDGSGSGSAPLRAALSLNPVAVADPERDADLEWWILSDLDDQLRHGPAAPDHVMGVGGATRSLIAQLPPGPADRALDLGTGCGIVALHLALRGATVATDLSERALRLARANARLNRVEGIDFRQGDLFAPVAGERFALIASNPPFVVTPRAESEELYVYRDGGLVGDALAERVVREGPALLAPEGTLLCLANWESPWGIDALARVRGWIGGAAAAVAPDDLAGWVIERDRVSPARYAETWARDGGARPGDPEFERLVDAWLDDFAERRIVALGLGSIRIRRLSARTAEPGALGAGRDPRAAAEDLVHAERSGGPFADRPGRALAEIFAESIRTARLTDAEVLAARWRRDPGVAEQREYEPGEPDPRAISLVTSRGIGREVTADTLLAAAIGACDGELSLGAIADALATLLAVDAGATAEALVAGVRELVRLGMLARAE